ncbi:MAG: metal ABC transporter ATP-binding protein [Clostridia bacterium]|nr:metal ABC transporter ATP-binding protein [Clostridia bacterium]
MSAQCSLCRIALEDVSVVRGGQTPLQDVSMHIHCGQLTVLIGQNGAGKTTLIRSLLGEIPHGGAIRHVDDEGREVPRLRTGYVPQHLLFDKEMPVTVEDFLAAAFSRRPVWTGVSHKTREKVQSALAAVDGAELARRPLGRCSGGEIQRVLLALAIHPTPDLLVLDEPVSGVDQNGLKMFLDTVMRLKEQHHMAILLVSHDLNLVRQYADHVALLDKSVLIQGTPDAVYASPEFQMIFGVGARNLHSTRIHGAGRWTPRVSSEPTEEEVNE